MTQPASERSQEQIARERSAAEVRKRLTQDTYFAGDSLRLM